MFVGMQNSDHYDKYTFMDNKAVGVSGLRKFYEYLVNKDSGKIESILLYKKSSITSSVREGGAEVVYTIGPQGLVDESLFEYPNHYRVVDYGVDSFDDGEHAPIWFTE